MTSLASAFVEVRADTSRVKGDVKDGFDKADLDKVGRDSGDRFSKGMSAGVLGGAKGIVGGLAGVLAAAGLGSIISDSLGEAREAQRVGNITANAIKVTGGAAKVTAEQVGDLAQAISNKTGIDDEQVQASANLLLTFKNIRNEVGQGANVFDRATAATQDLAAAGFGDADSAAKQLGKALNDPVKGIAALGKAGVTFSEKQKDQIANFVKTGDLLSAQKIILGEVESQVGGAAAAASDPMQKLGVVVKNLEENLGTAFLPVIENVATFLGDNLPGAMDTAVSFVNDALLPAFGSIGDVFGTVKYYAELFFDALQGFEDDAGDDGFGAGLVTAGLAIQETFKQVQYYASVFFDALQGYEDDTGGDGFGASIVAAGLAIRDTFVNVLVPAFQTAVGFITTQVIPRVLEIAGAFGSFLSVAIPIVQQFVAGLMARIEPLMPQVQAIFGTIGQIVVGALELIRAVIERVTSVISFIWENWGEGIMTFVSVVFQSLIGIIGPALQIIQGIISTATALIKGDWSGVWEGIKAIVAGAWAYIEALISGYLNIIQTLLGAAWGAITLAVSTVWGNITSSISQSWESIKSTIGNGLSSVKQSLSDSWESIKKTVSAAWGGIVTAVSERWNGLTDAISGPVKSVMTWVREHFVGPINEILKGVGVDFRIPFPSFSDGGTVGRANYAGKLANSFDTGGWTGPGGKYTPAGVVHADEFVVRKESQNRMRSRMPGVLDYINEHGTLPGFADGGLVGFISSAVSNVGKFLTDPVAAVGDMVRGLLDGSAGSNVWAQAATGALGKTVSGLVEKVKSLFTAGGVGTAQDLGNGRVSVAGHLLDATTAGIFSKASAILGGLNLMQGSWSTSVGASGGTHAGAGAMDVWPSNGNWKRAVDVLRSLGDIAWHRVPSQGPWAEHIHGITPGAAGLSAAAASQVASFRAGGNGLASGGPDNNGYWMGGRVKLPVFDNGGTLGPGVNLVNNATGANEHLLPIGDGRVVRLHPEDIVAIGQVAANAVLIGRSSTALALRMKRR